MALPAQLLFTRATTNQSSDSWVRHSHFSALAPGSTENVDLVRHSHFSAMAPGSEKVDLRSQFSALAIQPQQREELAGMALNCLMGLKSLILRHPSSTEAAKCKTMFFLALFALYPRLDLKKAERIPAYYFSHIIDELSRLLQKVAPDREIFQCLQTLGQVAVSLHHCNDIKDQMFNTSDREEKSKLLGEFLASCAGLYLSIDPVELQKDLSEIGWGRSLIFCQLLNDFAQKGESADSVAKLMNDLDMMRTDIADCIEMAQKIQQMDPEDPKLKSEFAPFCMTLHRLCPKFPSNR